MLKATLTFPNRELADKFTVSWGRTFLAGHDMSATDPKTGAVSVTVYNVDEVRKAWIDNHIANLVEQLAAE